MRQEILEQLYQARGGIVSGSELASRMNISRVAVWKHIEALKENGYHITSIASKGYCLPEYYNIIIPSEIKSQLHTYELGREIRYYQLIDSTNNAGRRIIQEEEPAEGLVIVAGQQTNGRGRRGRKWQSPTGGLWFSIILKPNLPIAEASQLSLVLAMAVQQALIKTAGLNCRIKWPNDIYLDNRKLSGILLEMSGEFDTAYYLIAGCGINANFMPAVLDEPVSGISTSLLEQIGQPVGLNQLLAVILNSMEVYYLKFKRYGFTALRDEFKRACFHLGKTIEIKQETKIISGINEDINEQGNLLLKIGAESVIISTGDVHILD